MYQIPVIIFLISILSYTPFSRVPEYILKCQDCPYKSAPLKFGNSSRSFITNSKFIIVPCFRCKKFYSLKVKYKLMRVSVLKQEYDSDIENYSICNVCNNIVPIYRCPVCSAPVTEVNILKYFSNPSRNKLLCPKCGHFSIVVKKVDYLKRK